MCTVAKLIGLQPHRSLDGNEKRFHEVRYDPCMMNNKAVAWLIANCKRDIVVDDMVLSVQRETLWEAGGLGNCSTGEFLKKKQ